MKIGTLDLEADGLLDTATRVWCGVLKDSHTKEVFKFRPHQIPELLNKIDEYDVIKTHHGTGYDWPLLKKLYGFTYRGKKVDTLLLSRLLNPKRIVPFNCPNKGIAPHSVEAWGYRVGRGKPSHDDWTQFSEDMLHRCSEDVEIQELTYDALMEEAKGGNWRNAFLLTFELFTNLQLQEEYGWLVDRPHMERCVKILDRYIQMIDKKVTPQLPDIIEIEETKKEGQYGYVKKPFLKSGAYSESSAKWLVSSPNHPIGGPFSRISFRKVDLNSGMEVKDFLLSVGWEPLEWNENDAGERTSPVLSKDDPFEGVVGDVGSLVARRVQARHRRSTIEGLFKLIREDGRIPSVINNLAVTARATHRNIVNIPKAGSFFGKHMRSIFTSKPGYVLVGTDSDGCQLRMLAGRMNNPTYTEALCNGDKKLGTDNHSLTAKIGELESRDIAKNTMYCLLFGGGDGKLAKTAKKPIGSGSDLRKKLYTGLDGLGSLMEALTKEWKSTARQKYNPKFNRMEYFDGTITGLDGRPIKVPYEHQLLVYLLQSDESIMMSKAYNKTCSDLAEKYKWGEDYGVIAWYHDEYTIECKEEIAEDVKKISEDAIAWAGNFYKISCPHVGQGKIGKNWYDIH